MASSRILNTTPNSIRQRSTLRLNASAERREERRARSTVDLVVQWEQHDQHRLLVCAGEEEKGGVVMMRGGGSGSGGGDVSSRRQVWRACTPVALATMVAANGKRCGVLRRSLGR